MDHDNDNVLCDPRRNVRLRLHRRRLLALLTAFVVSFILMILLTLAEAVGG